MSIARTPIPPDGSLGPLTDEVAIVDVDTGEPCPPGKVGELVNPTVGAGFAVTTTTKRPKSSGWPAACTTAAIWPTATRRLHLLRRTAGRLDARRRREPGYGARSSGSCCATPMLPRRGLRHPRPRRRRSGDGRAGAHRGRRLRRREVPGIPGRAARSRSQAVAVVRPDQRRAAAHGHLQGAQAPALRGGPTAPTPSGRSGDCQRSCRTGHPKPSGSIRDARPARGVRHPFRAAKRCRGARQGSRRRGLDTLPIAGSRGWPAAYRHGSGRSPAPAWIWSSSRDCKPKPTPDLGQAIVSVWVPSNTESSTAIPRTVAIRHTTQKRDAMTAVTDLLRDRGTRTGERHNPQDAATKAHRRQSGLHFVRTIRFLRAAVASPKKFKCEPRAGGLPRILAAGPAARARRVRLGSGRTGRPVRVLPDGCMDLIRMDGRVVVAGPDTTAFVRGIENRLWAYASAPVRSPGCWACRRRSCAQ